jgi:Ion channel
MIERYRQRRFQVLFGFLVLTVVATPPLRAFGLHGYALYACLLFSLLSAGLGGLGLGRGSAVVVLAMMFVVSSGIHTIQGGDGVLTASDAFLALASILAGVTALREALRDGAVTSERLYAATSVYLLAGLAFALIYHGLGRVQPGTLSVAGAAGANPDLETAIYFSFVTLATLGYGDVVPATPVARSLAICEAVGAQLFVAVLIARLVSLQSQQSS